MNKQMCIIRDLIRTLGVAFAVLAVTLLLPFKSFADEVENASSGDAGGAEAQILDADIKS